MGWGGGLLLASLGFNAIAIILAFLDRNDEAAKAAKAAEEDAASNAAAAPMHMPPNNMPIHVATTSLPPPPLPSSNSAAILPPGWETVRDQSTGKAYYQNKVTCLTPTTIDVFTAN